MRRNHLTVRNLPPDVAAELERERRRRGSSLNQTVIDTLRKGLGVAPAQNSNGLAAMAGSWTAEDLERFEAAVAEAGETIDEEAWR